MLEIPVMTVWANLFWLIIIFFILLALNRWITAHVQGVGLILTNSKVAAIWFYFFLFLPGILVHETGHYVMAVLLRVKVNNFSLWPKIQKRGELVLGSVQVQGAGPIRHSLVGAAPLLLGSLVVLLIGHWLQFNALGQTLIAGDLEGLLSIVQQSISTPDFWLWLYLLFAVANAMLPSPADRIYWGPVILFFSLIILAAVGFDLLPAIPPILQEYAFNFVAFMASALSIAAAVDLFFVLFISLFEFLLSLTTHRKVQY